MYYEDFRNRLTQLRLIKDVSARDMSLYLGQNAGYINNIESGKSYPSMFAFFNICEYFKITPKDFFDTKNNNPIKINEIVEILKQCDDHTLDIVISLVKLLPTKPQ